jgi:outer membrane protein assembly factor BamB
VSKNKISKIVIRAILAIVIVAGIGIILAVLLGRSKPAERNLSCDAIRNTQYAIRKWGSWPMFHGGQNLSGRAEGTLPDSMVLLWKFKTSGEVKSSPAIRLAGKPAIDDGLVFVGSADANVYAIDLKNGRQVWEYRTGDAVEAGPCVVGGSVFIGSSDGFLYAIDANSGQLKWKYQTGGKIMGAANWAPSPNGRGVWLLVGSYDNKLHCIDSANGKVVWTYETGSYINGSPAVSDGKVVFGGCDARIHVVSVADGKMLTQIDTGSYIAASAAIVEGQVYVGNYDNVFICGDIAAAKIVWQYTGGTSAIFSSPAVSEDLPAIRLAGVVVFGCRDKRVHCVSRDSGKAVWTFTTLGEVDSSPAICGDKVVVGSGDGRLYMLRLSEGKQVWSYEVGQPITSSPAVAGGIVVVGSDDGFVYAFGPRR